LYIIIDISSSLLDNQIKRQENIDVPLSSIIPSRVTVMARPLGQIGRRSERIPTLKATCAQKARLKGYDESQFC